MATRNLSGSLFPASKPGKAPAASPAKPAGSPAKSPAGSPARPLSKAAPSGTPLKSPSRGARAIDLEQLAATASDDESGPPPQPLERQEHIAHVVGYALVGPDPTPAEQTVLAHIASTYEVPPDFELDKLKFGPLSGTCHTQRLLANLQAGTLDLKPGAQRVDMCAACGLEGHWRSDCPSALLGRQRE